MDTSDRKNRSNWLLLTLCVVVLYLLSSGPVIALGCWLREATGNDAFYAAFWPYFPLFYCFGNHRWLVGYIEFWVVDVFHTVGPG